MTDYEHSARDYAQHRRQHHGLVMALVTRAGLTSASRVLEVGCGSGNSLGAIAGSTGCDGFGLDAAAAMLAQAQARTPPGRLCQGAAEALPFVDACFDLVFSVDVIHHVRDLRAYHQEAWRVLRPGGRFCTATDSEDIIRRRVPLSLYFPDTVAVELQRYPRVEVLRASMATAGLHDAGDETVECSYAVTSSEPYRARAYSVLHLISEEALQAGIARLEDDLRHGPVEGVARYLLLWGSK